MSRDLKGMGVLFQGVLWLLLVSPAWGADTPEAYTPDTDTTTVVDIISPSHTVDDSKPLRFGDPESLVPEEEIQKVETLPLKPVLERPTEAPTLDPDQRIREIIASVPKGSEYPVELEKIVAMGNVGVPILINIFEDASAPWQSRWIAGMALGRLGTLSARQTLEKGLVDPLFLIRMASIQALSRQEDRSIVPQLRKALSDRALVVRSTAVESLERMKDRDSLSDLIKELSAPHNFHRGRSLWIREQIIGVLGNFGGKEVIPPLLAVLQESELNLRLSACSALAQVSPEALPAHTVSTDEACVAQWVKWGVELSPADPLNADGAGKIVDLIDQP